MIKPAKSGRWVLDPRARGGIGGRLRNRGSSGVAPPSPLATLNQPDGAVRRFESVKVLSGVTGFYVAALDEITRSQNLFSNQASAVCWKVLGKGHHAENENQ